MNPLELLSLPVCLRLALALLHFLWQGALIAFLAVAFASLLGRRSSSTRYGIYMGSLVLMVVCTAGTYWVVNPVSPGTLRWPISYETPIVATSSSVPPLQNVSPSDSLPAPSNSPAPISPSSTSYPLLSVISWERYAPWVVFLYLMGVLLMTVRLILGLRGGQRLRRGSEPVGDAFILSALQRQAYALGLAVKPALLYCAKVTVPTVVGVIRPAILLPLSFASGLGIEQVEMLLCHELAHIRRWDPFCNVVQRTIEALLFFHPAVWFISRQVRLERENCCDDLVLQSGGSAFTYAASLLDAAQRSLSPSTVASLASVGLEATGKTSQIRSRVLRLVGEKEEVRLRRPMLVLLPLVLVGLLVVMPYVGKADEANNQDRPSAARTEWHGDPGTGSVHGRVIIDGKPLSDTKIIYSCYWPSNDLPFVNPVRTNSEGYFRVNNLPTGKFHFAIQRYWDVKSGSETSTVGTHSHGVYVDVVAGETTEIQIGGAGRKVVGKLVPVPNEKGEIPDPQGFSDRKFAGHTPRPEGLPGHMPGDVWILDINPDGTFEIPDLPPGDYTPMFEQDIHIKGATNDLAVMDIIPDTHTVHIPAATDNSNTPYNIGEIKIKMGRRLNAPASDRSLSQPTPTPTIGNGNTPKPQTGSVHGRVFIGRNAAPGELVSNGMLLSDRIVTTPNGEFHIDGLLPGRYYFYLMKNVPLSTPDGIPAKMGTHGVWVVVRAGMTEEITIGGKGQRIFGRLLTEDNSDGVPLSLKSLHSRYLTLQQNAHSESGQIDLLMEIRENGSFDIPDAEPGKYLVNLNALMGPEWRQVIAIPGFIDVPGATPGHEDEPYNVGEIRLRLAEASKENQPPLPMPARGDVRGRVLNADTGTPVHGAFVAIDHSGDTSPTNNGFQHRDGIYSEADTRSDGTFLLQNIAFFDAHPFYVTYPGFIRYATKLAVSPLGGYTRPIVDLKVKLRPGGWLTGGIIDANGQQVSGFHLLRLTATDGRTFPPLREDWPAFAFRTEKTGMDGSFRIGELDDGAFTLEAYRQPSQSQVDFYGSVSDVKVQAGATAEIQISPIVSSGTIEVQLKTSGTPKFPPFAVISRNMDLIELAGGPFHPEDERFGRILSGSLFRLSFDSEGKAVFSEFPPGEYAVFTMRNTPAGEGTAAGAVSVEGQRVDVKASQTVVIHFGHSE